MASPRDILDERLARGEIAPDEHARLAAHLSAGKPAAPSSSGFDASQLPKGSVIWGIAGIGMALAMYLFGNSITKDIVADCVRNGAGSLAFCQEKGVNWTFFYLFNALAAFIGLFGLANFALPKK